MMVSLKQTWRMAGWLVLIAGSVAAPAQNGGGSLSGGSEKAWVSVAPLPLVTATRTEQTLVSLNFRVARGFHINSNTPRSEFLIPTALKMDLPTDIVLGKIEYP